MVQRVVHLGFEVRVELVRNDGEEISAQLTRGEAEALEPEAGSIVWLRPPRREGQRLTHASGSSPRRLISGGSSPAASSASVTCSTTPRTLARTAIQISCRCSAAPRYSTSSGASPRTLASGPSTARMTSASEISSAGLASQ